MEINKNTKIGKIVAEDLSTAIVFEKYGIDFCCHGETALLEACNQNEVEMDIVLNELNRVSVKKNSVSKKINKMSIDELINHIIEVHHNYLKKIMPEVRKHIDKIILVHGENHTELFKIAELFASLESDILAHLDKEENVIYPYIRNLPNKSLNTNSLNYDKGNTVREMVTDLENEHERVGAVMDAIHKISCGYKVPSDACNTYRLTLEELKELENDMHLHIVKENQLLHPKAILLEKNLLKRH